MLIGLNGKLKSGKDTTFSIIKELRPEAERVSFAAKLKQSAAAALGIDLETLEWLKNIEVYRYSLTANSIENGSFLVSDDTVPNVPPFNVREYLQRVGTEAGRDVFGTDFWVDMALPSKTIHDDRFLVITDMRFPNEIDRVIELGGFTVRVNRFTETAHGGHASEQDIPDEQIDYELDNTGNLEDLRENIKIMLTKLEEN